MKKRNDKNVSQQVIGYLKLKNMFAVKCLSCFFNQLVAWMSTSAADNSWGDHNVEMVGVKLDDILLVFWEVLFQERWPLAEAFKGG